MMNLIWRVAATAAMLFTLGLGHAQAEPSLVSTNWLNEVTVKIGNAHEVFTVIRDSRNPLLWYYVPNTPRLAERSFNGKTEPEFTLIRFQTENGKDGNTLEAGGLLQFAVSLAVPAEVLDQLRKCVAEHESARAKTKIDPDSIQLVSLPVEAAEAYLYAPNGDLLVKASQGGGLAPVFATQRMVFVVELTKLGADVLHNLVTGNTGIAIGVRLKFSGRTEPVGFKVNYNWERLHHHYSTDMKFRASVSYFGIFGASGGWDSSKVLEELTKRDCVKIEILTGESLTLDKIQPYLQPVVQRINQTLLQDMAPPAKIPPAAAAEPDKHRGWFSTGFTYAVKDIKDVLKAQGEFSLQVQELVKRETACEGFIGIGHLPPELQKKLVREVREGPWHNAIFALPVVADVGRHGISRITFAVEAMENGRPLTTAARTWTPDKGWTNDKGQPAALLPINLLGLKPENTKLDTVLTIEQKDSGVKIRRAVDGFNKRVVLDPVAGQLEAVVVDPGLLSFRHTNMASKLTQVRVKLTVGERTMEASYPERASDGKLLPLQPLIWLIEKKPRHEAPVVLADVKFKVGGLWIDWARNGDLRKNPDGLHVLLEDDDYQQSK